MGALLGRLALLEGIYQLSWWWIGLVPLAALLAILVITIGVGAGIVAGWRVIKDEIKAEFGLGRKLSAPPDILLMLKQQEQQD